MMQHPLQCLCLLLVFLSPCFSAELEQIIDGSITYHQRTLPSSCVAFNSLVGKQLFAESWNQATSGMEIFFPLMQQFVTQKSPDSCGATTLIMVLNAMDMDPQRLWKAPWRWFSEDNVRLCGPPSTGPQKTAKIRLGMGFDEFVNLGRCNGATVVSHRVPLDFGSEEVDTFRAIVKNITSQNASTLVVSYFRPIMGQTGSGHFAPIGGYHAARDMVLILDVARFKLPPHWVPLQTLVQAMSIEADPGLSRGYIQLTAP